jgi:DNA-binding PadR family transcriptional regulator
VNLTRLMALGTLAQHGPQHGHQIRRIAELTNVSEWGGVSVGALYRELRVMEGEGLVEVVRTEQVGRRPARTVYAITDPGRAELILLRELAIHTVHRAPDPLGVALTFAAAGLDREELMFSLRARREAWASVGAGLEAKRHYLVTKGYVDPLTATTIYRAQLLAETEVRWHDEFAKTLAGLPPGDLAPDSPGGQQGHPTTTQDST